MFIHAPQMGVFGEFDPQKGQQFHSDPPKGSSLHGNTAVAIQAEDRETRVTDSAKQVDIVSPDKQSMDLQRRTVEHLLQVFHQQLHPHRHNLAQIKADTHVHTHTH